jgi:hypothetical protein
VERRKRPKFPANSEEIWAFRQSIHWNASNRRQFRMIDPMADIQELGKGGTSEFGKLRRRPGLTPTAAFETFCPCGFKTKDSRSG